MSYNRFDYSELLGKNRLPTKEKLMPLMMEVFLGDDGVFYLNAFRTQIEVVANFEEFSWFTKAEAYNYPITKKEIEDYFDVEIVNYEGTYTTISLMEIGFPKPEDKDQFVTLIFEVV